MTIKTVAKRRRIFRTIILWTIASSHFLHEDRVICQFQNTLQDQNTQFLTNPKCSGTLSRTSVAPPMLSSTVVAGAIPIFNVQNTGADGDADDPIEIDRAKWRNKLAHAPWVQGPGPSASRASITVQLPSGSKISRYFVESGDDILYDLYEWVSVSHYIANPGADPKKNPDSIPVDFRLRIVGADSDPATHMKGIKYVRCFHFWDHIVGLWIFDTNSIYYFMLLEQFL